MTHTEPEQPAREGGQATPADLHPLPSGPLSLLQAHTIYCAYYTGSSFSEQTKPTTSNLDKNKGAFFHPASNPPAGLHACASAAVTSGAPAPALRALLLPGQGAGVQAFSLPPARPWASSH